MKRATAAEKIIGRALKLNRKMLNEAESKRVLQDYGIPVARETLVFDADAAVTAAKKTGYPVVVKGVGRTLVHKTDHGLVRLSLVNSREVRRAVTAIKQTAGPELEGVLVQPQLAGGRELAAGLFRDPLFGPVIMFGVGGIFTEAFNDVSFGLTPLPEPEMDTMIDEISAKALLKQFRGEPPVDRRQLKTVLHSLSRIATNHPEVQEVDINPLMVSPQGDLTAVDAMVALSPEVNAPVRPLPVNQDTLERLFNPKSIAFIGASATMGKWGQMLLTNTIAGGYEGEIYMVNPKGGIIAGRHVHPSVSSIEGEIDLAVVTIPANGVADLIPQLKEKGTLGMLLITSGFRETGEAGKKRELQLVSAARKAKILILGPNTMGICNPHGRLFCNSAHVRPRPGTVTLVCQSGSIGTQLLSFAEQQDIGIRAYGGSGNEAMVTIEDYMETFGKDDLTRTVAMYVESIKDGRRFFNSARSISMTKPMVILRGGRTHAGGRAAAGHTGAMASDVRVFDAVCRQTGIIPVKRTMELLDLSAAFSALPLPQGNRVAVITLGGGWGVVTADLCTHYRLKLPSLPDKLIRQFDAMLPEYWSRSNPVDIVGEIDLNIPKAIMASLLQWDGCDAVIHLGIHGKRVFVEKMLDSVAKCEPPGSETFLETIKDEMIREEKDYLEFTADVTQQYEKPVLGVSLLADRQSRTLHWIPGRKYKSVFFPSPERAVKALAAMCRYREWRDRQR